MRTAVLAGRPCGFPRPPLTVPVSWPPLSLQLFSTLADAGQTPKVQRKMEGESSIKFGQRFRELVVWPRGRPDGSVTNRRCSIRSCGGGARLGAGHPGARARPRPGRSEPREQQASHDLLDAVPFETAGASLLLHLACGSVARAPTVAVAGGGGEFHVLLVQSWGMLGSCK